MGFGGVVIYEQVFTERPDALKSLSQEWLEKVPFAAAECARETVPRHSEIKRRLARSICRRLGIDAPKGA